MPSLETMGAVARWVLVLTCVLVLDIAVNVALLFVPRHWAASLWFLSLAIFCATFAPVLIVLLLLETRAFKAGYAGHACRKFTRVFLFDFIYLGLNIALLVMFTVRAAWALPHQARLAHPRAWAAPPNSNTMMAKPSTTRLRTTPSWSCRN
jgi:hypothetical protein